MFERVLFVIFGAILAWLFQQYRVLRSEDTALINEHIKDVEKFRDVALDYWLNVVDAKTKEEPEYQKLKDSALAAKVRAAHAGTTIPYETIISLSEKRCEEYKSRSRELYDLATGGNFESQRDGIDPSRALDIFDSATRLIHLLREIRRDIVSIRRLFCTIISSIKAAKLRIALFCIGVLVIFVFWSGAMTEKARPASLIDRFGP